MWDRGGDADQGELRQYAGMLSGALRRDGRLPARRVARAVEARLKRLDGLHRKLLRWARGREALPRAAEWMLDNRYLLQRAGQASAGAFRGGGRIPAVRRPEGKAAAVEELARGAVLDGALTPERMAAFLRAAQEKTPLEEEELSLFVPAVQAVLLQRAEEWGAALLQDLHGGGERLEELGDDLEQVFSALRALSERAFSRALEGVSRVEELLRRDPAGVYPRMGEESRARYRQAVCRLARRTGRSQAETARLVLRQAQNGKGAQRHVGWQLFCRGGGEAEERKGALYVWAVLGGSGLLSALAAALTNGFSLLPLLFFPVSDAVKAGVDALVTHLTPQRYVHRLDLRRGVPEEGRTLCVIASLLTAQQSGEELAQALERYRLTNRDGGKHLLFGILADLPDSKVPMGTVGGGYVEAARRAVDALNERYGGGFFLFFRPPVFHSGDGRYMGWERKRGALLELAGLLRGKNVGVRVLSGDRAALEGVRYVITLDGDTRLNAGTATELIGAMLHPLNRPEVDRKLGVVRRGYGMLQPRIGVALDGAIGSPFARLFAGRGGVDPYSSASSDVYHDLCDQGSYTGKGIFEVDAFLACMEGRFPRNRILSHDLLEGSYLRTGLIGDVELSDGYPRTVNGYFRRLHRWVRGDWQLLAWLGGRVRNELGEKVANPIPGFAKWKILDNLRRSLSPPAVLTLLLLGLCVPGKAASAGAWIALAGFSADLLLAGMRDAWRWIRGKMCGADALAEVWAALERTGVGLALLPYHAWVCLSAAATALWRSTVTHRDLLAWVTSADAERSGADSWVKQYAVQWPCLLAGVGCILGAYTPAGAAAGGLWLFAGALSRSLSRPAAGEKTPDGRDRDFLLGQAALMWRYFERFLVPEHRYLPPDNCQVQPPREPCLRTSPTNIGMALLAVLSAEDLGLCPRDRAVTILREMLETLEKLPKWHGHLYNWYDTASGVPLAPRFVSSVDSGNLCACLVALGEGLAEWGERELARRANELSAAADFARFYDADRGLLRIGWDAGRGAYSPGWYDLMASEARLTSYLAVARGQVPLRHWRRLGRGEVRSRGRWAMVSWTGSVFEYFMPNLLLPVERGSLMHRALAACVRVQGGLGRRRGIPWGFSESCFCALDKSGSYRYKAHGAGALGLRRGLDEEWVSAPYASFLALCLVPERAVENLRQLEKLSPPGEYGPWEAVDFTERRMAQGRRWETAYTVMAHHLGMSLAAIDNALRGNAMQKRFLRSPLMNAYRELLQERADAPTPPRTRKSRGGGERGERLPRPDRMGGRGAAVPAHGTAEHRGKKWI